ncbi:MAG TPA: polyprenyl synthetase family protein [Acetobacteraceae bacterium]|nr:polyprenyl synthetase family protein [Acetobacteraceae bacterium]
MAHHEALIKDVLDRARVAVAAELERLFAEHRRTGYGPLYDQLADYPFREGKGLRPAICFAACRGVGGQDAQAGHSAAALELFHNGALLHDDIEDASLFRRGGETLFRRHGVPIAINVGDASNVFSVSLLLRNVETLGVRKALQILGEVERMSRESVEGQAIELDWIRQGRFDLGDQDYVRMAHKKTCWYTVIAPLRVGVICGSRPGIAEPTDEDLQGLIELGHLAGIAFQIHDDLLNLEADEVLYGKEISGDLFEGKRTVMLLHFLRTAPAPTRERALRILQQPRSRKRPASIIWLLRAMQEAGSLGYGRALARSFTERALEFEPRALAFMSESSDDRLFLREMLTYVIDRLK